MPDLERMFMTLGDDSEAGRLAPADRLRLEGDRRRVRHITTLTVIVGLVVAGGLIGTKLLLGGVTSDRVMPGDSTSPSVVPSPSAVASPPVSPSPSVRLVKLTDKAFLQLADINGQEKPSRSDGPALPPICKAALSGGTIERQARHVIYWADGRPEGYIPDGTFEQTVTRYQPGAAMKFMSDLRAAVAGCANDTTDERPTRYAVVAEGFAGDGSLLFSMTAAYAKDPVNDPDGEKADVTRLISVVRVGDAVTILWEQGWEDGGSDRALVDLMTSRVVKRIEAWLKG